MEEARIKIESSSTSQLTPIKNHLAPIQHPNQDIQAEQFHLSVGELQDGIDHEGAAENELAGGRSVDEHREDHAPSDVYQVEKHEGDEVVGDINSSLVNHLEAFVDNVCYSRSVGRSEQLEQHHRNLNCLHFSLKYSTMRCKGSSRVNIFRRFLPTLREYF